MKARLSLFLLIPFLIAFAAISVHACSCTQTFTVKQKIENAGNVVIVRLDAVNQTEGEPAQYEFSVERVFKGEKKPGDQIRFRWENMCSASFNPMQIGERFLYFLSEKPDNDGFFAAPYCYGWGGLSTRTLDLLYLEKPAATRLKTRIAGTIEKAFHDPNDDLEFKTEPIAGKRIRIAGSGISRFVTTDGNGNFEIYGLPPGKYRIYEPTVEGWQANSDGFKEVTLKARGDSETSFLYELKNVVSGRLVDREGRPFDQVRLMLFPEDKTATIEPVEQDDIVPRYDPFEFNFPSATTDDSGEFEFTGIAPGRYRLVVNRLGEVTSDQPFGAFFFPGTTDETKATVLTIGAGTKIEKLVLTPPNLVEMITISGRVVFQDGKPAEDSFVEFLLSGRTDSSRVTDTTDENGRFKIQIAKGTAGTLEGWYAFYPDDVPGCPQLKPFLNGDHRGTHIVRTEKVEFDGTSDRDNIMFELPFAACEKEKPQ